MNKLIPIVLALTLAAVSFAQDVKPTPPGRVKAIVLPPEEVELKPGAGLDRVRINCLVCHSADYITMQPPSTKTLWTAVVKKMVKVFGAHIGDDDARTIADYLARNYGAGN